MEGAPMAVAAEEDRLPADDAWEALAAMAGQAGEDEEREEEGEAEAPEARSGGEEAVVDAPMEDALEGEEVNVEADADAAARSELWSEAAPLPEDAAGEAGMPSEAGEAWPPPALLTGTPRACRVAPQWAAAGCEEEEEEDRPPSKAGRYFDATGLAAQCSDDGHISRKAARVLCAICLDLSHQMRDCPQARCASCFQAAEHFAEDCPALMQRAAVEQGLFAYLAAAMEAVAGPDPPEEAVVGPAAAAVAASAGGGQESTSSSSTAAPAGVEAATQRGGGSVFRAEAGGGSAAEASGSSGPPTARVRCVACGAAGAKHANCSEPPAAPFVDAEAAFAEAEAAAGAAQAAARALDAGAYTLARWSRSVVGTEDEGRQGAYAALLDVAALRLLGEGAGEEGPWRDSLASAPASDVVALARRLWRLGALLPGVSRGVAPQLTVLGWWLSQLQVPPQAACTLLHGALWGVLLPMAVLVVLLESAPPDLSLSDGTAPPRKSGHFALLAAYFRWREGRETGLSRRFGADFFWEAVDQRVVAVCKHTQQALGYDGDDAAFEEMDGELMDVRRNDGRPWTLASAVGSGEGSPIWARFCAALAAAFPPQAGAKVGEWVVRTEAGDGAPRLETAVSSQHAVLFAPGGPAAVQTAPFEVEVGGQRGALQGGEGAFEEALEIRRRLLERLEQALDGGAAAAESAGPTAAVMDEADVGQALSFLRGAAGALLPSASAAAGGGAEAAGEAAGIGLLDLLGRAAEASELEAAAAPSTAASAAQEPPAPAAPPPAAAPAAAAPAAAAAGATAAAAGPAPHAAAPGTCGVRYQAASVEADVAAGQGGGAAVAGPPPGQGVAMEGDEEEEDEEEAGSLRQWASSLATAALLRALKRRAAAAEDYDLARLLKAREGTAAAAVADCRHRAASGESRAAALERLARRKRKAVEEEDYGLAARLKRREVDLTSRPDPPKAGELERLAAEKAAAVAAEDFERAAALRAREGEVEAAWRAFETRASRRAAALACSGAGRGHIAAACGGDVAAEAGEEIWAQVAEDLREAAAAAALPVARGAAPA